MATQRILLANGSTMAKADAGSGLLSTVLSSPTHDPGGLIFENAGNPLIETSVPLIGAYSSTPAPTLQWEWTANANGDIKIDVHYKVISAATVASGASTRTNDTVTVTKQTGAGAWTKSSMTFGTPADFSADIVIFFKIFRDIGVAGNLADRIFIDAGSLRFEYDDGA